MRDLSVLYFLNFQTIHFRSTNVFGLFDTFSVKEAGLRRTRLVKLVGIYQSPMPFNHLFIFDAHMQARSRSSRSSRKTSGTSSYKERERGGPAGRDRQRLHSYIERMCTHKKVIIHHRCGHRVTELLQHESCAVENCKAVRVEEVASNQYPCVFPACPYYGRF